MKVSVRSWERVASSLQQGFKSLCILAVAQRPFPLKLGSAAGDDAAANHELCNKVCVEPWTLSPVSPPSTVVAAAFEDHAREGEGRRHPKVLTSESCDGRWSKCLVAPRHATGHVRTEWAYPWTSKAAPGVRNVVRQTWRVPRWCSSQIRSLNRLGSGFCVAVDLGICFETTCTVLFLYWVGTVVQEP